MKTLQALQLAPAQADTSIASIFKEDVWTATRFELVIILTHMCDAQGRHCASMYAGVYASMYAQIARWFDGV